MDYKNVAVFKNCTEVIFAYLMCISLILVLYSCSVKFHIGGAIGDDLKS